MGVLRLLRDPLLTLLVRHADSITATREYPQPVSANIRGRLHALPLPNRGPRICPDPTKPELATLRDP